MLRLYLSKTLVLKQRNELVLPQRHGRNRVSPWSVELKAGSGACDPLWFGIRFLTYLRRLPNGHIDERRSDCS